MDGPGCFGTLGEILPPKHSKINKKKAHTYSTYATQDSSQTANLF